MDGNQVRVDIEEVRSLLNRLAEIDAIPLAQMDLFENGQQIELTPKVIEDWRFVGMTNRAFIEMEFWNAEDANFSAVGEECD